MCYGMSVPYTHMNINVHKIKFWKTDKTNNVYRAFKECCQGVSDTAECRLWCYCGACEKLLCPDTSLLGITYRCCPCFLKSHNLWEINIQSIYTAIFFHLFLYFSKRLLEKKVVDIYFNLFYIKQEWKS